MPLVKCKCGSWTNHGLLCTACQLDLTFEFTENSDTTPTEEEKEYSDAGMSVVDEEYFDEDYYENNDDD